MSDAETPALPTPEIKPWSDDIRKLYDRAADGVYADDRQTSAECAGALKALGELAELANRRDGVSGNRRLAPARKQFDAIMAEIPPSTCLHGVPFADLCAECVKSDEFDPLNVLDFCAGAIEDAIGLEDGLDGEAGSRVLSMIRTAKARAAVSDSERPTPALSRDELTQMIGHGIYWGHDATVIADALLARLAASHP